MFSVRMQCLHACALQPGRQCQISCEWNMQAVGSCGTALATSQFADNTAGLGGAVFLGNYGRLGGCSKGSCRCPPESRQSPAFDQVPVLHVCVQTVGVLHTPLLR